MTEYLPVCLKVAEGFLRGESRGGMEQKGEAKGLAGAWGICEEAAKKRRHLYKSDCTRERLETQSISGWPN